MKEYEENSRIIGETIHRFGITTMHLLTEKTEKTSCNNWDEDRIAGRAQGYTKKRLLQGFEDWKSAGVSVIFEEDYFKRNRIYLWINYTKNETKSLFFNTTYVSQQT